jgi:hypothetical protein
MPIKAEAREASRRVCAAHEPGDFYLMDRGYVDFERLVGFGSIAKTQRGGTVMRRTINGVPQLRDLCSGAPEFVESRDGFVHVV